jgi:formylglycine-generating enzyme required for sulfatase activity
MAKIRVFLSYSSADREIAERIHSALEAAGYDVFFDRDSLPAGESFDVRILDAIGKSHLLIFLVSPESIKAGAYTLTELGFARRKWANPTKRVLPVVLREINLGSLPVYLRPVTLLEPKGNIAAEVVAAVHELSKQRWRYAKWSVVALSILAIVVAIIYYTIQMREQNCHLAASNAKAFANRMIDYANTISQHELEIIIDFDSLYNEEFHDSTDVWTDRGLNFSQKANKVFKLSKLYLSKKAKIEEQLLSVVNENNFHMRKLAEESNQYRLDLFARCLDGGDNPSHESDFSFDMKQSITEYASTRHSPRITDFVNLGKKLKELADRATGEDGNEVAKSGKDYYPEIITNSIGMKFVLIQEAKFKMGSGSSANEVYRKYGGKENQFKDEHPKHDVIINRQFYLQNTEVSQGQWKKVMGVNPSHFKDCGDDCPVETVSWQDAQKFINKLNAREGTTHYRLPTEAEWEYACRAGTTTAFSFGDNENALGKYAWYHKNSNEKPHRVGTKNPNAWGLYDMHGNVWEWVEDDWHNDYTGAPNDGSAWINSPRDYARVLRGCGYPATFSSCRSADRVRLPSPDIRWSIGFRLARYTTLNISGGRATATSCKIRRKHLTAPCISVLI